MPGPCFDRAGMMAAVGLLFMLGYSEAKRSSDEVEMKLVSAHTRFGFKLFSELIKQDPHRNIFISPPGVMMALTMAYNGAEGQTQRVMTQTLELEGLSLPEVNHGNAALKNMLESPDSKIQLIIANSLWARKGVQFKPEFVDKNRNFYKATLTDLDFGDPNAALAINAWVKAATQNKITRAAGDKIDPATLLFLLNAIYFKGTWRLEFDKAKTAEGEFTTASGRAQKHPLMSQSGYYSYYQGKGFQAVALPYGKGQVSMYIFLPAKGSDLEEFYSRLDAKTWEEWMPQFHNSRGHIVLPRLRLNYDVDLNNALRALGMGMALDPALANFAHMCTALQRPFIQTVEHAAFVEVNEEGTEAAAVTSVGVGITAEQPTFSMVVNRPFFSVIRDSKTGLILFMGSIVEPE